MKGKGSTKPYSLHGIRWSKYIANGIANGTIRKRDEKVQSAMTNVTLTYFVDHRNKSQDWHMILDTDPNNTL